jgi:succinate-acetate transporter protein
MPDLANPNTLIKDLTANPAPLGLCAFGMTTVLLNMHNAGFFGFNSMILGMGLFYGGCAQVIAGAMEWKKGNTFATTAFISYGMFWLSLVALVLLPNLDAVTATDGAKAFGIAATTDGVAFAAYLAMWGLFTAGLFIGTFRLSAALQVVFGSLTILFFLLAAGKYSDLGAGFNHFTGFEGIFCGLSAIYAGVAQVLNEVYGKTVLPLGLVAR